MLLISPCVLGDPTKNQCELVNVHFSDQKKNNKAKGIKTKTLESFKLEELSLSSIALNKYKRFLNFAPLYCPNNNKKKEREKEKGHLVRITNGHPTFTHNYNQRFQMPSFHPSSQFKLE